MEAYVHFGYFDDSFPPKPKLTEMVEAKIKALPEKRLLHITPRQSTFKTVYLVLVHGKWRRVIGTEVSNKHIQYHITIDKEQAMVNFPV